MYTAEAPDTSDEMNQFLGGIDFPKVDPSLASELDCPITLDEIINSINSLQSKKSPGPGRFPSEFYKKFHDKLAPLLLAIFEESLEVGTLPATLRQACISLSKKGRTQHHVIRTDLLASSVSMLRF